MRHASSWATQNKDEVVGGRVGEVGYEIARAEWLAR
jgi:hypothetical protein